MKVRKVKERLGYILGGKVIIEFLNKSRDSEFPPRLSNNKRRLFVPSKRLFKEKYPMKRYTQLRNAKRLYRK